MDKLNDRIIILNTIFTIILMNNQVNPLIKLISSYFVLFFAIGYFFTRLLLPIKLNEFYLISLSIVIGMALQLGLDLLLLYSGNYSKLNIILFSAIISTSLYLKIRFSNVKPIMIPQLNASQLSNRSKLDKSKAINLMVLVSIIFGYILLSTIFSFQTYISDRFAGPFIYFTNQIVSTKSFNPLTFSPPFTGSQHSVNQNGIYFGYKILNATIIIATNSNFQTLLHYPIFGILVLPLTIAGVYQLTIMNDLNSNNYKIIFMLLLFLPDPSILTIYEVTAAGIFGRISFAIIWLSIGTKVFYLKYASQLKSNHRFSILIIVLLLDLFLAVSYWSHSFYLWMMTILIIVYGGVKKRLRMRLLYPILISNFLVTLYQLLLYIYVLNKQNWSILPTLLSEKAQLFTSPFLLVLSVAVSYLLFPLALIGSQRILDNTSYKNFSDNVKITSNKFIKRKFSEWKNVIYLEALIIMVLLILVYILRFKEIAVEGKDFKLNESNNNFTIENIILVYHIIEYITIAILVIVTINLHLKDKFNNKTRNNLTLTHPLFIIFILGYIFYSPIIFLVLGGSTVLTRAFNYLIFIPLLVIVDGLFNFEKHKLVRSVSLGKIYVVMISVIMLTSQLVVYETVRNGEQTSFYNDEMVDIIDLENYINMDMVIYTDNRLASGIISYFNNVNVIPLNQWDHTQIEQIWYSYNASEAYNFIKAALNQVHFVLLSHHFTEFGIYGYDYRLENLDDVQYQKFFSEGLFQIIYEGKTLTLLQVV